jgi:bacillithiol system protein YtxJ
MFNRQKAIPWQSINSINELDDLLMSQEKVAIFKHSTRCSISTMAYRRLENISIPGYSIYYLDLLNHRDISNQISSKTGVEHQSPQLILLQNSKVIGSLSHNGISQSNIDQMVSH